MKTKRSNTSLSMIACLILLSLGAGCNQPTAPVSLAAEGAGETSTQAAIIQIEMGSRVLFTTSLDLSTRKMGKATTLSLSPFKHDAQDCGLSVSCCFVGAFELADNYRLKTPITGDVIGIQVSLVTLDTNELLFSKSDFFVYNQSQTTAFDDHGVKIIISPEQISD